MPAFCMAAISASASPRLPCEAAPMGHTRVLPAAAARSRIERVTEALSFTGRVLGMGQTAVKPPRAAARVPVSMVSEFSPPGSRRWQCRSMKPGATTSPVASSVSAHSAVVDSVAAARFRRRDASDAVAVQPHVHPRVGAAGRIDHASVLNP